MEGISGLFAPVVTAFTDDGSTVSDVRMSRQIRHLLENGISGFIATTDTGEFLATSFSERKAVLEIVVREAQGRPVIAHVSTMSTSSSLDLAQHAGRHGARAAVLMAPYYGRYTDEEVARFFEAIASYANIAIIAVDPLNRVSPELLERLKGTPMVHVADPISQPILHPTFSDSFRLDGMVATPAALLIQHGDLTKIDALLAEYSGKRVCKAGFEILDLDLGSPRAPAMPLPFEVMAQLRTILESIQDS